MKKRMDLRFAWVVGLIGFIQPATGQSQDETAAKEDRDAMTTIATYPADVRSAVLGVAQYPQALVKLERIQARSSQSFQDLIAGFPREEQERFYEASRFPERLDQLVRNGKMSNSEVLRALSDLPSTSQTRIAQVYSAHFGELKKMNVIYQSSQEAMQKILSDYPQAVQADFQKVISKPEVMNLMTENIDVTVALGEDYRTNPTAVIAELDALNSQYQQDFAAYKKEVESNPEMQKELQNAADGFTSSYSQSDGPVDSYLDNQPASYSNSAPVINNYYNYNPYPYWFSYPYWYATPIWYPVPYYYHTGFYYGPGGRIVIWGYPSYSYSNWFFHFGYRQYPHLYNRYHTYYYGHYSNAGRGGRYNGYHRTGYDYGSRTKQSVQGNRGRSAPTNGRVSTNSSRTSMYRDRTSAISNNNRVINSSGASNNNRRAFQSNRSAAVSQSTPGTTWNGPVQQNVVRPSNSGGRSIQQIHSNPVNRSSFQHSGGGSKSGTGGTRGGNAGSGGRRGR